MAGASRSPSGRSRPAGGAADDTPNLAPLESDPPTAPITANSPLPPLTPLPLASDAGAGAVPAQSPPPGWSQPTDMPTLPPLPPAYQAPRPSAPTGAGAASGVTTTWAAQTMFALLFTSVILLTAMAIAYTAIIKSGALLVWVVVLIVVLNVLYAAVISSMARPGPAQPWRLPFMSPRRGP